ncbi:uncharacterized protein L201_003876 [Kwoniella dendrophila CBS 6074]|uniref:Nuclear pore complex protein n=1 Tax=Kwoniella dendrophila CBS 6074 TaxID=1295534 RepID=A0AAX4JU47_9TREE
MNASRTSTLTSIEGMVHRTISSSSNSLWMMKDTFHKIENWTSHYHAIAILIIISTIVGITRIIRETNRGRLTSRQIEKQSNHRIEQSPRRQETKLDASQVISEKPNSIPSPTTQSRNVKHKQNDLYLSAFPDLTKEVNVTDEKIKSRMIKDKELYWKLQNLEDHLDVIDEARERLVELFNQVLYESLNDPTDTILSLPEYESESLCNFLENSHRSSANRYEAYLDRRKNGGPREMFPSKEYALEWLRLSGVVKYVDGSWLGGILGIGTGKTKGLNSNANSMNQRKSGENSCKLERNVSKMAWQVISEEFGDGDLEKNHIYLYEKLLNEMKLGKLETLKDGNVKSSSGDKKGFDGLLEEEQGIPKCWEAAIAQQCIGLLSSTNEFFPEALGFNMSYESLPYHLLVTTKELKELKLNNYYFQIHVTIDNSDSGHSAMARLAVEHYLKGILERDGFEKMQQIWKRIQLGYLLAEGLPTTPSSPIEFEKNNNNNVYQPKDLSLDVTNKPATLSESKMIEIIMKKSKSASKMHCPCNKMKIGQFNLEEWLNPLTITKDKTLTFLRLLSLKKPFVIPGNPEKSLFIKDLNWNGKMFGAFTKSETDQVKQWIISLNPKYLGGKEITNGTYERFIGHSPFSRTRNIDNNDKSTSLTPLEKRAMDLWKVYDDDLPPLPILSIDQSISPEQLVNKQPTQHKIDFQTIRSIWYTSTSLFENFQLQTSKFACLDSMFTLRILRIQLGFSELHLPNDICNGIEDVEKNALEQIVGLWELGEKLDRCSSSSSSTSSSSVNLIDLSKSIRSEGQRKLNDFCSRLLDLRLKPYTNSSKIFGVYLSICQNIYMNQSLVDLFINQEQEDYRNILERINQEQIKIISEYINHLRKTRTDQQQWEQDFLQGYYWVESELSSILSSS